MNSSMTEEPHCRSNKDSADRDRADTWSLFSVERWKLHILGPSPLGTKPPFPVQVSLSLGAFHFFVLPPSSLAPPTCCVIPGTLPYLPLGLPTQRRTGQKVPFFSFLLENCFCLSVFAGERKYSFIHYSLFPYHFTFYILHIPPSFLL